MNIKACLLAIPFLLFAFNAQAALTDAQKCGFKKAKALTKYSQCLDKAYAKYYWALDWKTQRTIDAAAERINKCHERCVTKMAAAEKNGLCAINTDSTNPDICGVGSVINTEVLCRFNKTRTNSCTYPP
jgi:hypothetical protein